MKNSIMDRITITPRPLTQAERIRHLWEKLNTLHHDSSVYFKRRFADFTFDERIVNLQMKNDVKIFTADLSEEAIGYSLCSIEGVTGEIDSLFVHEQYRKKGIGDLLMQEALKWLEKHGANNIKVSVVCGNDSALHFYARHGLYPRLILLEKRADTD